MAGADLQQLQQTFTNALVYTVCAEIVQQTINSSDTTSLIVLVVLFALIIAVIRSIYVKFKAMQSETTLFQLIMFAFDLAMNIIFQFESTLVARTVVAVLSPSSSHVQWTLIYAIISVLLLWLLVESTVKEHLKTD